MCAVSPSLARMPEFYLPSANKARAGAGPVIRVGEECEGTRYPDSVYIG